MDKNQLNKEIKKTLKSLDNIQQAEVKPFFYTRLAAKMDRKAMKEPDFKWQWAIATVALVIILNGYAFLNFWPSDVEEEEIELLAEEYSLDYTDLYSEDLEP